MMLPNELQPNEITDLVSNMEECIDFMRTLENDHAVEVASSLEEYLFLYFRDEHIDKAKLKKQTLEMVNNLYLQIMQFDIRDAYVDVYFDIVLGSLFDQISQSSIHIFFILDDDLEDDRFMLVKELFELMLFEVVTPYEDTELLAEPGVSRLPGRHFGLVEEDIVTAFENKKNVLYFEKDGSISYIHRILDIAEKDQDIYQCLYRNKPVDTKKALWIKGKTMTVVNE